MGTFNDITSQRFGRLVVTAKHEKRGHNRYWLCRCDCHSLKWIAAANLFNNHAQSCGCLNIELTIKRSTTHGKSKTPTYKIWKGMRKRCNNINDKKYSSYGGRGITVCKEWDSYEQFFKDMGDRPSDKHSIDRINNNEGYCSDNCRWALRKVQMNNSRANILITHNGITKTMSEWSDLSPVNYNAFWQRLNKLGWSMDRSLSAPCQYHHTRNPK